ncbi:hypothetical protein [Faecalicatena fissicatena]|uniref:Uncharacterized protein n=1 Tax=Faecalicatena fissicatena TaxID=290055 RepID=A0ABS2E8U4_9FIRM|nr:hypothetical protein [Faecalicatena fissicatena]MBM6738038.1 hypothetical protein [Faecalicatena fissicatena]
MHIKSRMMAFGGLALALCILFMALGSVFETGTLFFLAASSFFVGIVIREAGMKLGLAFYLAAVLLGFILAPNKFYVVTFGAMGLYILAVEGAWRLLAKSSGRARKRGLFWVIKYLVFNVMYIPAVFLLQGLLFSRELSPAVLAGALAAGQAGLWIYDNAYEYAQAQIWTRLRGRLLRPGE